MWNIVYSRTSIWVLLELVRRWTQHFTQMKSTWRNLKLNKFTFGTLRLLDLLSKHWFASSVWNFCHWVQDVPLRKTSPAAKSMDKRMYRKLKSLFYPRDLVTWWEIGRCMINYTKKLHPKILPVMHYCLNKCTGLSEWHTKGIGLKMWQL